MKTLFTTLALLLSAPTAYAAETPPPRVKARPKLRTAPAGQATAAWQRAGGMQATGKVTAFEHRVLRRMARLPKIEVLEKGELRGYAKDRFGYPIHYALKRIGDSLSFSISRHNASYDRAASVRFTQGGDGMVERQVKFKGRGWGAAFARDQRSSLAGVDFIARDLSTFAATKRLADSAADLAHLRNALRQRNAEYKETPFDRWYGHAAGY